MVGAHRALVDFARRRVIEGARDELAAEVREQAHAALALLAHGLGDYKAEG